MTTVTLHLVGVMLLGAAPAVAVEWGDAPDAVRKAVARDHPDAEVHEVRKARHRTEPGYLVKITDGEARVRLDVRADGAIREERTDLQPEDLPEAVAATLAERFPGRRVVESAEKIVRPQNPRDSALYHVEMTVDGRVFGVVARESGAILNVD